MQTDRPRPIPLCDNCGRRVPPTYFKTYLSDGVVKICGPACGDEYVKAFKLARNAVRWVQVER